MHNVPRNLPPSGNEPPGRNGPPATRGPSMMAALLRLARAQGGHVTRHQLVALGFTRSAIAHLVARGFLIRVYRSVYAVGRLPVTMHDRAHGALLAAGPGAGLAGGSAAALCGLRRTWPLPFEVVTARDRRPSGLVVLRYGGLLRRDFATIGGLRTTSRARTVLDSAPQLRHARLVRAVNGQRIDHGLPLEALHDVLERFPRHPGHAPLLVVVEGAPDEPARSDWELEWPGFADDYDLPEYETNVFVCGHRVDVRFKREGVIVELDGWRTHGMPEAFERDREVAAEILARTGMPVVRITYRQFHDQPAAQAERLHLILARRRRELALLPPSDSPAHPLSDRPAP